MLCLIPIKTLTKNRKTTILSLLTFAQASSCNKSPNKTKNYKQKTLYLKRE